MIFNKKISRDEYIHIINDVGWYIDKKSTINIEKLKSEKIRRSVSEIHYYTHPNIYISSLCNGNCKYCYQEEHIKKKIPMITFSDVKFFLENLPKFNTNKVKFIELFGGEPLLHPEIMDIIKLIKSHGYNINIATNGTLPILEKKEFIKLISNNVHIRISLDGHTKELHETYRTKDSFNKIIQNIKFLKANNIDMSLKTIITDKNFKFLPEILYFFKNELKIKNWNYNVLYNIKTCKENKISSKINHYDMIKELCKDRYFEYMPLFKQTPFTQFLINIFVKNTNRYYRTYIFLNYDNNIYLHDQLINDDWKIGENGIVNSNFFEKIRRIEFNRNCCNNCFGKNYCYLGNYGELYDIDKTLECEFPTCNILRKSILYLMKNKEYGVQMIREIFK